MTTWDRVCASSLRVDRRLPGLLGDLLEMTGALTDSCKSTCIAGCSKHQFQFLFVAKCNVAFKSRNMRSINRQATS